MICAFVFVVVYLLLGLCMFFFFFSSRRRHTRCALVTGVQTCALPISIFAWVIAILIAMGGLLAINGLGVESYPNIAPPQVTVAASYPGASAETTEDRKSVV